ncbi:hypothetical protein Rhe02_36410 [Rhizocola hellebori]|uniref:Thioredoxin domain-containing protein n=1 Tax=Rhizocola hellebori TaxID=1392758 RepID=A0A8J3VFQ5_9ACTN|nr:hypothetical protein [Rhizocola hellebori]GIH05574.1 hypothetical protein Rhe02_36410 [Rhizocola hellebori]
MAALWAAFVLSTLVAVFSLTLTLALARRVRVLVTQVNRFLPVSEGDGLPDPGTPLPEFTVKSSDGTVISRQSFAGPQRLFIFLTTGCSSCTDQIPVIQQLRLPEQPVVVVIGDEQQRFAMAAQLADAAQVVQEEDEGPLATALELREFPAVLVLGEAVVTAATHSVKSALAKLATPVGV